MLDLAKAQSLSTLLELQDAQRHFWDEQDLREMARHQLSAPLRIGLGNLCAEVCHQMEQASPPPAPMITIGQLLALDAPPQPLLKLVKRFAKSCLRHRDTALPSEIVMMLYYGSIASSIVRLGQSISDLPPVSLLRGLRWLSDQTWIDDEVRTLLKEAIARTKSNNC